MGLLSLIYDGGRLKTAEELERDLARKAPKPPAAKKVPAKKPAKRKAKR